MKVGDYVAKVQNKWQTQADAWMEVPNDPPIPLGVIVSKRVTTHPSTSGDLQARIQHLRWWEVLESCGKIGTYNETRLKVVNESR